MTVRACVQGGDLVAQRPARSHDYEQHVPRRRVVVDAPEELQTAAVGQVDLGDRPLEEGEPVAARGVLRL